MSSVTSLIEDSEYSYLLSPRKFTNIKPHGAEKLKIFVDEIYNDCNSKVIIFPDTDIDGLLATKIMYDTLKVWFPVEVMYRTENRHGITHATVMHIIKNKYTHLFILDSSTNEINLINNLCNAGVKVCVIDHHVGNYEEEEYSSGSLLLNNQVTKNNVPYKCSSCGLLCALYCNYLLAEANLRTPEDIWVNSVITLYSDCMNSLDPFNVMIINYVRTNCSLGSIMHGISGKKSNNINREVITYSINPKINACIRLERFDIIYTLLFGDTSWEEKEILFREINKLNKQLKEYLNDLEKRLPVWERGNISLVDMTSQTPTVYTNFKGMMANRVASQTGNMTIGYYLADSKIYGSVRDPMNRDCLNAFKQYCIADGHKSAFGFTIEEKNLDGLLDYVENCLDELEGEKIKPLVLSEEDYELSSLELMTIGTYNEYATSNVILIKVRIIPETFVITSSRYGYTVKSNKLLMTGNIPISYGMTVLAQPTLSTKLILKIKTVGG